MSGKRDTLTFFSWVRVSSRYRNSRFTFRISIISSMPRLAANTAPDQDQARGSPSSPNSETLERSTEPDQVGDVGGARVVRRVGADADAAGLRDEDALHRHLHEVAVELVLQARDAVRAELALDLDAVGRAELAAHGVWDEVQRRLVHRAAVDAVERAGLGVAVASSARLSRITMLDLPPEGGRAAGAGAGRPREPAAAALK